MAAATVHVYACGHFDPYVEPHFATTLADQLAFLTTHVPVHSTTGASAILDPGASA